MPRSSLNLARPRQASGLAKISSLAPIWDGAIFVDSAVFALACRSMLSESRLRVRGTHVLRGVCATRFGITTRAESELRYSSTPSPRPWPNKHRQATRQTEPTHDRVPGKACGQGSIPALEFRLVTSQHPVTVRGVGLQEGGCGGVAVPLRLPYCPDSVINPGPIGQTLGLVSHCDMMPTACWALWDTLCTRGCCGTHLDLLWRAHGVETLTNKETPDAREAVSGVPLQCRPRATIHASRGFSDA